MQSFFEMLLMMMPTILKLLDKTKAERELAQSAHEAALRAAVKSGSWEGIMITSTVCRVNKMETAELQAFIVDAQAMASAGRDYLAAQTA